MRRVRRVLKNCAFLLLTLACVVTLLVTSCREPAEINSVKKSQSDTKGLFEKIKEAEELYDSVIGHHDGSDVDEDKHWVSHDSHLELGFSLELAKEINGRDKASKEEIEHVLQRLENAMNAIREERQPGKKSPPVINKSALVTAIADANTKMEGVGISDNGFDIPDNKTWVKETVYNALSNAVASAQVVNNKETASQEEIDAAVKALGDAIKAFVPQTANVNRTLLTAEIAIAQALLNDEDLQISENGSDVHKSRNWVTPSAVSEFSGAIAAAVSVSVKTNAVQNEINTALQNLKNASEKFNNGKELGKNEVDRLALNHAITAAESNLANVVITENGSTVLNSVNWVNQDMADALRAACEEAKELYADDHATQDGVNAMAETLNNAIREFKPQPGLLTAGGISYVFNQPEDENIVLSYAQTLSWVKNDQLKITVTGSYDSYQWTYIDGGNVVKNVSGNSLTVNARDFGTGVYSITLKVTKNSVPYTKTLTFIVE